MIKLGGMEPELRPYAEYAHRWAEHLGLHPTVTSVRRTWAEQQRLRDRYLAGKSRFPANKPGDSSHQFGLSWDSWVPDDQMPTWVAIRRAVGWRVFDSDNIHGELPNWRDFIR